MRELHLRVSLPGAPERGYRFSETPVLIGRAENCHLSVRHAAVPRELCRIWLEDGGRRVRVEERPGLTNPLLRDGIPVRGGAGGPRLALSVGPVRILAEPARYHEALRRAGPGRRLAAGLGLLAVLAGLVLILGRAPGSAGSPGALGLPPSPVPPGETAGDAGDGRPAPARAALLESRAADLVARPDASPAERIEALLALRRAALLRPPAEAEPLARRAAELERTLVAGYREQALALERALARSDGIAASRAAASLLSYLERRGEAPWRERLAAIAAAGVKEHHR